ncbi:hypothetical protein M0R88_07800 [Halorussus gelatinilyticus]|uniref:Uncharacterized protein n=1 Tax=Halorussus gelatinilyticus TaxID=2937524 RepID=A0A8U0IMK9_9EURY|nr:hypothetical protein [Halorussus gelatinilyticus]UPW01988.1 hypothetical protein M0R88_07800 [Halorussus gelatinilyticus]
MKQSSFRYLGAFDLLLVAVFLAVFGVRALTESAAVPAMALAGVSAILAGSVRRVSVGPLALSWRHFVALTYALFGVMLPASYLPGVLAGTASRAEVALFVVTAVGALSLLFFGYDVLRGGDHFDVEPNVETVVGR